MCLQLHYKESLEAGSVPKVVMSEIHITDVDRHVEILTTLGSDSLSPSPALKGQNFSLEISRLLTPKSFLSEVKSQESVFKRAYLVICVLVLKSRDLIERRTSMHPKYCKGKKT